MLQQPVIPRLGRALRAPKSASNGAGPRRPHVPRWVVGYIGYPRISFALVLYFDVHISIEHTLFLEIFRSKFEISIRNLLTRTYLLLTVYPLGLRADRRSRCARHTVAWLPPIGKKRLVTTHPDEQPFFGGARCSPHPKSCRSTQLLTHRRAFAGHVQAPSNRRGRLRLLPSGKLPRPPRCAPSENTQISTQRH